MTFYVEEPSPEIATFFERDPEWPCKYGHEECSFRSGGPCSRPEEGPCTCETTGVCARCQFERERELTTHHVL